MHERRRDQRRHVCPAASPTSPSPSTYDAIPRPVRERARIQMLDGIGVGLASNAYPFAARAMAGIAALGGAGDCTVIGRPSACRCATPRWPMAS